MQIPSKALRSSGPSFRFRHLNSVIFLPVQDIRRQTLKACILVRTKVREHSDVAARIKKMRGVLYSFPVMGRTDVVAAVKVGSLKDLSELALRISRSRGVSATETLIGLER